MSNFHVAIIGAGLGGLCLSLALRRAGVPFDLFERDPAPSEACFQRQQMVTAIGAHEAGMRKRAGRAIEISRSGASTLFASHQARRIA
ncbi:MULTISPECIES: NAD(P)/FAD-dependent oxidoreductase [Rhizobium]|uniref:FAD-dependent oxidoreductase n=1 Tax=Rhizobium TaxID=379 RepID=UPI00195F1846|nr:MULTISPECIES: NAD(P)-binding protein [Rhizobium]MBM7046717.1 NAD(P)-binding protein [Rhizobium lusitanum]